MKNIFLIGMPSSGKSTLGRRLAQSLGYRFVDTDRQIIREQRQSINDIFQQKGEDYFRELERRVLRTIRPGSSLVVSTGGGMPCFHDNMAYIKQTGISVFLDVPSQELAGRMIRHNADDRPLFHPTDPELLATLQQKYDNRRRFYQQADVIMQYPFDAEDMLERIAPLM